METYFIYPTYIFILLISTRFENLPIMFEWNTISCYFDFNRIVNYFNQDLHSFIQFIWAILNIGIKLAKFTSSWIDKNCDWEFIILIITRVSEWSRTNSTKPSIWCLSQTTPKSKREKPNLPSSAKTALTPSTFSLISMPIRISNSNSELPSNSSSGAHLMKFTFFYSQEL